MEAFGLHIWSMGLGVGYECNGVSVTKRCSVYVEIGRGNKDVESSCVWEL